MRRCAGRAKALNYEGRMAGVEIRAMGVGRQGLRPEPWGREAGLNPRIMGSAVF